MVPYVIEERGPFECANEIGCPALVDMPGLLCADCGREEWTATDEREWQADRANDEAALEES